MIVTEAFITVITPESDQCYIARAVLRIKATKSIIRNSIFIVEFKDGGTGDRTWVEVEGENICIDSCHFTFREVDRYFDEGPEIVLRNIQDRKLRKIDGLE